jgi:hypothetical protein
MRELTKKQIKYLTELAKQGIKDVDEMTGEQWGKLVKMNDCEILWQNANRFLWDYHMNNSDVKDRFFWAKMGTW